MSKFGFVGLGRMGQSMAINMSKKGFGLAVFDIRNDAMKPVSYTHLLAHETDS